MKLRLQKAGGFTLLEVTIGVAIIIFALVGLLATYIACLELNETTKNSNLALNAEQKVLEEMRRIDFLSVYSNYNGYSFNVSGMAANASLGRVSINNSNPNLLKVDIGACWRQKDSKIIGECTNSGGNLIFSDTDGNGILNSPVQITTAMAQR